MTVTAAQEAPEAEQRTDSTAAKALLSPDQLELLIAELGTRGYTVIGPTVRDGAIVYGEIASLADMPAGWIDDQKPGAYRLERRNDPGVFQYAVGPQSLKSLFFPPQVPLWRARRRDGRLEFTPEPRAPGRLAVVGVRPCELAALAIHDRVLLQGTWRDPIYDSCRKDAFIVAVNCSRPGGTCFCASTGTGPAVTSGFDLALTEMADGHRHEFLVQVGSKAGAEILAAVPHGEAEAATVARAASVMREASRHMGRSLETGGLRELLYTNAEHPRWDEVARRCLSCTNCTMACPTCFCTTVEDVTDLAGDRAERRRRWDSCFTLSFSYVVGGSIRRSTMSRYRQWLTHKLATWQDQFGTMGCVGCGRCITWCPAGIDLTEEVAAMRGSGRTAFETAAATEV